MPELPEINIKIASRDNGNYDAYIGAYNGTSEDCVEALHAKDVDARGIGTLTAKFIDKLDSSINGVSHLKDRYDLVATDGYEIERTTYPDKESAQQAMQKAYALHNHNTPGDTWDNDSQLNDDSAILFDRGDNVYLWSIFRRD